MRARAATLALLGLIVLGALAILLAPLVVEAQQPGKVHVIGILSSAASSASAAPYVQALKDHLRELGWIEGQNIAVEERYSAGKLERLPELAADLVRLKVDAIIAVGQTATRAAMAATKAIPIVMAPAGDAVATGLIASFARPGGNVTGISILTPELTTKGLELLKEAVPKATRIAVLFNPDSAFNKVVLEAVHVRAQELGTVVQSAEVRTPDGFGTAFATQRDAHALLVVLDPFTFFHAKRIADLANEHRLPSMYGLNEYVLAGGLMAYGPNTLDLFRRSVGVYVDRILKGAKPANLSVQQPTRFELVINLKTARALGLTVPPSLLLRADQVIE